jgi:hypothetical protein
MRGIGGTIIRDATESAWRWATDFGVEHEAPSPAHLTVTTTPVNALADIHVESMSDEELSRYLELLRELRELVPAKGNPRPCRAR